MSAMQPFPGDPGSLKTYGTKYERLAQTILEVSQKLTALVQDQSDRGDAVAQLREKAEGTSAEIKKVQRRYHETALALVDFAVSLDEAQGSANGAIATYSNGTHHLSNLHYERRLLEEDRLTAMTTNADPGAIADINADIRRIDNQIRQIESEIASAQSTYDAAEHQRHDAIIYALARIIPVLDELNDTAGDYVRAAFESVVDFFEAIGKWVTDVLLPLLETILTVIAYVVLILVVLVAVLVILAAILLSFGVVGAIILGLIAAALIIVAGYLIYTIVQGTLQPTPTMRPVKLPDFSADGLDPDNPYTATTDQGKDLMEDGYLDDMGGTDSTVIEVIKVVGEDGVTRWRVILPSTQDWEFVNGLLDTPPHWDPKGDQGAMNDLASNVMLMMTPELQAAYERAVRQAMTDAGVKPGEEIMMVGWSQGGILAGAFASDTSDEFNVTAIMVGGSPIDAMPIPPNVSVISVQHPADVVHQLDLTPADHDSSHWVTIAEPPETDQVDHGAQSYAMTADHYLNDAPVGSPLWQIQQQQAAFYGGTETTYAYQGSE